MNYAPQPDQTHEDPSAAAPTHAKEDGGLTPVQDDLLDQISALKPGKEHILVNALKFHPEIRDLILERATKALGNETVHRVLELVANSQRAHPSYTKGRQTTGTSTLDELGLDSKPAAAAPEQKQAHAKDESGLTPVQDDLLDQISALKPGKESILVNALKFHPEIRDLILARATKALGHETVQRVLELIDNSQRPHPTYDTGDQTTGTSVLDEMGLDSKRGAAPEQAAAPEHEKAWIAKARAFNRRHSALVAEFNQLTSNSCAGPDGEVDPTLVVRWQQEHGVAPDGRVGVKTVAAAREGSPDGSTETAQSAPADDAREARPEADRPRGLDMI